MGEGDLLGDTTKYVSIWAKGVSLWASNDTNGMVSSMLFKMDGLDADGCIVCKDRSYYEQQCNMIGIPPCYTMAIYNTYKHTPTSCCALIITCQSGSHSIRIYILIL
eukprot:595597_1